MQKKYNDSLSDEKKMERNARARKWRQENPERIKNNKLLKSFGITLEEYNRMLLSQENKCFICGKYFEDEKRYFSVDHDHKTGIIRGLLCSKCNRSLGWYEAHSENIKVYLNEK